MSERKPGQPLFPWASIGWTLAVIIALTLIAAIFHQPPFS